MAKSSKKAIVSNQVFLDTIAEINRMTAERGWDQAILRSYIEEFSDNKPFHSRKERLSQLTSTELVAFFEWYKEIIEKPDFE